MNRSIGQIFTHSKMAKEIEEIGEKKIWCKLSEKIHWSVQKPT